MARRNQIILDTSILIDLQKGNRKAIKKFEKIIKRSAISRITACEFIYGSKDNQEKKINKDFLESMTIYEVTEEVSKYSYILLDKYGLKTKFGIADALIASTCIVNNLDLWTLNKRHFQKIKELNLYGFPPTRE